MSSIPGRMLDFAKPLMISWITCLYIYAIHYILIYKGIAVDWRILLLFLPIIPVEALQTEFRRRFTKKHPFRYYYSLLSFPINIAIWFCLFYCLVYFIPVESHSQADIRFFGIHSYAFAVALIESIPLVSICLGLIWLSLYLLLTYRLRILRIFSTIFVPIACLFVLFIFQLHFGGNPFTVNSAIDEQPGVEIFFRPSTFKKDVENTRFSKDRLLDPSSEIFNRDDVTVGTEYHPRDILLGDGNALIITLGNTFYFRNKINFFSPVVLRIDLDTDNFIYKLGHSCIQDIISSHSSLYVAPWDMRYIYQLSNTNLELENSFINQVDRNRVFAMDWEPMTLLKDIEKDVLYVCNEFTPGLISYDLKTNKLMDVLNLEKHKLAWPGGTVMGIVQSPKDRKLYILASPGDHDIIEVDPDGLIPLRTLDLKDMSGSALAIDSAGQYIYYQSAYRDDLYKINVETFEVVETFEGEYHARRMVLDEERNAIYLSAIFKGKVVAVDINSGKRLWEIKAGGRPYGLALGEDTLWVNSMAGILRLDLETIFAEARK